MKILMKKNEQPSTLSTMNRRARRRYFAGALTVLALSLCTVPAMAAGSDPLIIVSSLSDFIFNIITEAFFHLPQFLSAFHSCFYRTFVQQTAIALYQSYGSDTLFPRVQIQLHPAYSGSFE